jgi:alkylation response protein AidB-like acyl-CoA dehydrogenase
MEMAKAGAPGTSPFGPKMCAPVIMKYGSAEQKARHLPPMLNSDLIWCQGYSEPGSGSDLASLRTKAERQGDFYIVNGQKTWTTLAQTADWIFCLVRTSNEGKPQEGISFLLIDMKTPGISVEPIITADGNRAGTQEVNSVFFTDVKVPVENRVGEENKGWTYAKYLLEFERGGNPYSPRPALGLRAAEAAGAVDAGRRGLDPGRHGLAREARAHGHRDLRASRCSRWSSIPSSPRARTRARCRR